MVMSANFSFMYVCKIKIFKQNRHLKIDRDKLMSLEECSSHCQTYSEHLTCKRKKYVSFQTNYLHTNMSDRISITYHYLQLTFLSKAFKEVEQPLAGLLIQSI